MGKKKKRKSQLPFRLNILFFIIFLLFSTLIVQLGVVQILYGENAQNEIDRTEHAVTKIPVPRGKMYDRNGNIVVDNEPLYSITYTPTKRYSPLERLELANKLSQYITKNVKKVTTRDKKDYWILINHDEAYSKLTEDEKANLTDSEQYQAVLDKITEADLSNITPQEENVIAIKRELDQAFALTPHIVKNNNVSVEEYATVAEHLNELPGINVSTDWDREYPFGFTYDKDMYTFRNFIGSITTSDKGLPADNLDYFLARGYSRNDRVGITGLEEQYEMVLKGQKEQIEHTTDKSGNLIDSNIVQEGKRGSDLVLTVDMELQQKVDQIAQEELKTAIEMYPEKNQFMKDALVVMMNPKTGEILAMSGPGYDRKNKKFIDDSFNVLYAAHRPGSIVKGATLLSGYDSGVVKPREVIYDHPIKIQGTPEKSSYKTLGKINDLDALRLSSNVYMFNIAMRMGGEFNYQYNQKIKFDPSAFQTMRNYFAEFGLGVKTGIDFPYEADGYKGYDLIAGKLMDFAIGQFDTFTTLQLAQYVSTIANDGYRMKPGLVKEIHEPISSVDTLGPTLKRYEPQVLNKIEMDPKYIDRVQEGFREVFQEPGGTGYWDFYDAPYKPAGKTGTAQNEVHYQVEKDKNGDGKIEDDEKEWRSEKTENLTLIGYAPYDNPEVAFAVVVPNTGIVSYPHYQYQINKKIGRRILDAYFELKKERAQPQPEKNEKTNDIKEQTNQ